MLIRFRLKAGKYHARVDGRSVIVYLKGGREKKQTGHHCMLPGDIIECYPEMLQHFKDMFTQIDPDPPPPEPTAGLFLVDLGDNRFNVINENTGFPVNNVPVSKEIALSMVNRASPEDKELAKDDEDEDDNLETADELEKPVNRIDVTTLDDKKRQYIDDPVNDGNDKTEDDRTVET